MVNLRYRNFKVASHKKQDTLKPPRESRSRVRPCCRVQSRDRVETRNATLTRRGSLWHVPTWSRDEHQRQFSEDWPINDDQRL